MQCITARRFGTAHIYLVDNINGSYQDKLMFNITILNTEMGIQA